MELCEECKGTGHIENSKDQECECIFCDGKGTISLNISKPHPMPKHLDDRDRVSVNPMNGDVSSGD